MIQLPLDISALIGSLFLAATVALFRMLYRLVRTVDRIEDKIGSPENPNSISGKIKELGELRDWAISQGFQTRKK